jgi:hypothetical protein
MLRVVGSRFRVVGLRGIAGSRFRVVGCRVYGLEFSV